MSGFFQGLFKGDRQPAAPSADDFADFAGTTSDQQPVKPVVNVPSGQPQTGATVSTVPYTKWYRVWERTSPKDFVQEAFILPFILFIVLWHVWGSRKNRRKAKVWVQAHLPTLQSEFAVVGYGGVPKESPPASFVSDLDLPESLLKEKSLNEFTTYATGRQNLAFVDVSLKLLKRYNPMLILGDWFLGLFFESIPPLIEKAEITAYAFDGKEKDLVPHAPGDVEEPKNKSSSSSYDGFVFAIVHKSVMRQLRHDRYDVSLTFTKDNPKLPEWATVMSEAAEITDMMLTPDLIKAVEAAGDLFESLIVTDQPTLKPTKINETTPGKRVILTLRVPSSNSSSAYQPTLPVFEAFLRLTDRLVSTAHFRPEVLRKLRATREEEIRKLKRADEEDKAEERKLAAEKLKKEERERLLRSMSAEEQRKYLEKERAREAKREAKKYTRRA
ncbi:hypothetical protein VTO42DRAFT_417 [Malbranchea cinnamomea]